MTRRKLKRAVGGSDPTVRFVSLRHYLLNSQAWRTMPEAACKLLIDVWKRYNGVNNGEISYGCREAKALGYSRWKSARMFAVLIERGFLVVVRESTFARKKISRTWRITDEPAFGKEATKDFMRWRPNQTEAREQNFHSHTGAPDSHTGAPNQEESPAIVTPVRLSRPKSTTLQSQQCDTYSVPWKTGTAPAPMTRGWKPSGSTRQRAREDLGMRYGETHDFVRQFRDHHLQSGELSADWNQKWLDFVQRLVAERGQEEEK